MEKERIPELAVRDVLFVFDGSHSLSIEVTRIEGGQVHARVIVPYHMTQAYRFPLDACRLVKGNPYDWWQVSRAALVAEQEDAW